MIKSGLRHMMNRYGFITRHLDRDETALAKSIAQLFDGGAS